MEYYSSELERVKARRLYFYKRACFISPFVFAALFVLFFHKQIPFPGKHLAFSLSTCAVALVLAGTYYYAYKFFTENFYFYIFISWVANAVYLVLDLNGPDITAVEYPAYKIFIFILSLLSSAFLLLAVLSLEERKSDRLKRVILWTVTAGIAGLCISYILITQLGNPKQQELARWMLPGSVFAFGMLCIVGTALRDRIRNETPRVKGRVLLSTFYVYAFLQFFYPFTPFIEAKDLNWLLLLFLTAQIAKVGNAITMTGVLQSAITHRDFMRVRKIKEVEQKMNLVNAELQAQQTALKLEEANVEKKKQFVELGILASSIKHDVSTPLATMAFEIAALKNRYQHETGITRKMESLEYSMARIYAILQVVDIFRGDQIFFDRDQYMSRVNMLELVHRAVRSVKNEKKELKQVNAKSKIVIDGKDVWARAYAPMFEQVIVNIIKNGLEAIDEANREKGLVKVNVYLAEVSGWTHPRCVKIDIEDNGAGIPEENLGKLTSLFTTRSDRKPNSGIGLFIGKKIMDIHSGKMEFESTVEKGTKVTLLLPEWTSLQKAEPPMHDLHPESNDTLKSTELPHDDEPLLEAVTVPNRELSKEGTNE